MKCTGNLSNMKTSLYYLTLTLKDVLRPSHTSNNVLSHDGQLKVVGDEGAVNKLCKLCVIFVSFSMGKKKSCYFETLFTFFFALA